MRWGFNTKQRPGPPDEVAEVRAWVARNSAPLSALAQAVTARRMLDQATGRLEETQRRAPPAGTAQSWLTPWTTQSNAACLRRTRSGCSNGRRPRYLARWTGAPSSIRVRRALLDAVGAQRPSGRRLVTFFAVMYYAGLRPEEAINLGQDNVILLPAGEMRTSSSGRILPNADDWGELHLRNAPSASWARTNSPSGGSAKRCAETDTRTGLSLRPPRKPTRPPAAAISILGAYLAQ